MDDLIESADVVVVGAGISGATLAERYADLGHKVLVLEKRNHIGGNCYDFYNQDGVLVSKYGAHLFHTNESEVIAYIKQFANWYPYEHRVLAKVDGMLVPIPVNMTTVNKLFGLELTTETEMEAWLAKQQIPNEDPQNGEEAALARVGKTLYEKMFKNYTKKQWDRDPRELDAEVLNRIPVRTNRDDRYFNDDFQALPEGGYTKMFERILDSPQITVLLNTDYFKVKDRLGKYNKLFYTGPIDRFFEFKHKLDGKLEYRSINFVWETHDREFYQENSVINHPQFEDGDFTRIVEYKHFTKQKHPKTTISKEFSVDHEEGVTEPYYPVPNPKNRALYEKYRQETEKLSDIYFVGRLANYKYFNMDQAFKNALDLFDSLEGKRQRE